MLPPRLQQPWLGSSNMHLRHVCYDCNSYTLLNFMKQGKRDQKFKIMTNDTLDYKDDANRVHFST